MKNLIKTEHFLFRQWDRSIPEDILEFVATRMKRTNRKLIVIISRKILRKYNCRSDKELFLVVENGVLITGYFEDLNACFGRRFSNECLIINDK